MNRMIKSFFAALALFAVISTAAFAQTSTSPSNNGSGKQAKVRIEYQPATIEKAQQILKEKGFYKGEVTGKIDAATKASVKAYQQQEGLTPTGHLNKDTRVKLGIEAADNNSSAKPAPKKNAKTPATPAMK